MQTEPTATREQVREMDRLAIQEHGVPGAVLMENAGLACVEAAVEMLGGASGRKVVLLCGRGNNGGDGFVIARRLAERGASAHVVLLASTQDVLTQPGEASENLRRALDAGLPVEEALTPEAVAQAVARHADADLIVDAMLGTGTAGQVREPYLSAIEAVNSARPRRVLAVDVPSGLDCNTGKPLGAAVRAERTVTFVARKVGFTQPGAGEYTGRVEVADIGIPPDVVRRVLAAK